MWKLQKISPSTNLLTRHNSLFRWSAFTKVTSAIAPSIPLTLYERIKQTQTITRSTKFQRLQCIVHQYPHILSPAVRATKPFRHHSPTEGYQVARYPSSFWVRLHRIQGFGLIEQTYSSVDSDQLVIVREVGVDRMVERERNGRGIQASICLGVVANRRSRKACQEFIDIPNPLDGA